MGILNVTPDSFSDGGCFLDPDEAADHALALVAEGAEIIDVGGESTRPGAVPVSEVEELRRVMPVLERLAGRLNSPVSIDTYKPRVAREALMAGASVVNDIGATQQCAEMWELVKEHRAGYVLMHMQGTPATMQVSPSYGDVEEEVREFFGERLAGMTRVGIDPEQIVLDVGIGFGKRREHNLELLRGLSGFSAIGRPMVLGVSRKSFLTPPEGGGAEDRVPAGLAVTCWAVQSGVQIIRTHDVRATLRAVRMWEEILQNSGRRT